ncbi:MAG: trimethylamine methyltransferase family protein [Gammaproteobacteria bacterium]|nr:trimethylamine methyltransferase family protein [Gammaproteobacteria bacterium]MDH3447685.1 trimethylamine methyltransferase family protein [Gammaproteobacteria bacterium]
MARRSNARQAKIALRKAALAEDLKPVHPGESGGQYKPLADTDVGQIEATIFRILEEVGFADATEHCIETCRSVGATYGEDKRLRFPRAVVEDTLGKCQRELTLHGQDPRHDLQLSGSRVHFSTAGAAVMIADPINNEYRETRAQDLYDMARIADRCEHIHMFQRTCVLRDITDNRAMDINTAYNAVMGTTKHIGSSWTEGHHLEATLKMLHLVAGGEDKWRERPFMSISCCHVVPPMKFTEEALGCIKIAVEGGMPVLLLSAGQSGATAPACLAGAVAQAWAECLGGLVYVNAIKPGAPAILGTWPFVSDLRTGAMSGGSPEQAILSSACAQMGNYFNLPTGTACGMTDSKFPDFQGGAERAYTLACAATAGANIIYEAAGMYASLLGACPESLLMDNDVLGAALRITRGIEVNERTLSFDVLQDVCLGNKGHYLGSGQTLEVMQTEYLYPELGDRLSPNQWVEQGKPVLLDKAIARKQEILGNYFPDHVSDEVDRQIRAEFPIFLPREAFGRDA